MANTSYGVNSPEAVKLWSRKLFHEALKSTYMGRFMGTDSNSLIQVVNDTSKGPGDRVRTTLRMLLSGGGISGDGTLEGNEEALTTYTDDTVVNQLRHAVRSGGKMSEQRIPFSVREEARSGLTDWWADRIDTWGFNQLAGFSTQSDTRYTGLNSVSEPDASHHYVVKAGIVAKGSITETSVGSATSSNRFRITHIDTLVKVAKTASPMIRPVRVSGEDYYVMFLSPEQVLDLRTEATTAAAITWFETQKARIQGGEIENNGIFTGALGVYNGVVLHESTRVPYGSSSGTVATVRRAIFCGAQAATMAFGRGYGASRASWREELFDYGNQLGVSAGMIAGLKKTRFNSADFGTIVLSTGWTNAA